MPASDECKRIDARDLDAALDEWLETFEHATASGDADIAAETKRRLEELGYLQE